MAAVKLGRLASSGSRALLQQAAAKPRSCRRSCSTIAALPSELRDQLKERLPAALAGAALTSTLPAPAAYGQQDAAVVDEAVSSVVEVVRATGEAVKQGLGAAQTGADYARQAYEAVAPVVKSAVETAAPVVERGVKAAADAALPALQNGLQQAGNVLTSTGVDPKSLSAAEQAVSIAKPVLQQAVEFLTTAPPTLLGEYALGLIAAYYLAPPVLKAAVGALRGYAGDVTPAAALAELSTGSNCVLLDIRGQREKEQQGIPELPNSGKLVELEYAAIEDRKVRSQLRSAADLEAKVTALQIAALKRLGRGTTLYLLDRSGGGGAKAVARELASRGFGRVYLVSGGFQGWVAAKLRSRPSSVVSRGVEVLPPGTNAAAAGRQLAPPRGGSVKQLPGGRGAAVQVESRTVGGSRRQLPSSTSAGGR